ncbi:unnamed protein product [marine sediment metagenome]|uniref:Uncharacterized protein n=1 Tax=marine sediment metagenome TaxID=412755 RepID=X1QAU2_9ZZZZ
MLYNLSTKDVPLKEGESFLTIEFRFLDEPANGYEKYSHDYQGLTDLKKIVKRPIKGSLMDMQEKIDKWRERLAALTPTMLIVITVIIMILTFLFGSLGIKSMFFSDKQNASHEQEKIHNTENSETPENLGTFQKRSMKDSK